MPWGGKREGAGKKKRVRLSGDAFERIAERVKAEELRVEMIQIAAEKARKTSNTADLLRALDSLDSRRTQPNDDAPHTDFTKLSDAQLAEVERIVKSAS